MDDTSGLATFGYFSTLAESIVLFFFKKKTFDFVLEYSQLTML